LGCETWQFYLKIIYFLEGSAITVWRAEEYFYALNMETFSPEHSVLKMEAKDSSETMINSA
jgi:hypothetical protein